MNSEVGDNQKSTQSVSAAEITVWTKGDRLKNDCTVTFNVAIISKLNLHKGTL